MRPAGHGTPGDHERPGGEEERDDWGACRQQRDPGLFQGPRHAAQRYRLLQGLQQAEQAAVLRAPRWVGKGKAAPAGGAHPRHPGQTAGRGPGEADPVPAAWGRSRRERGSGRRGAQDRGEQVHGARRDRPADACRPREVHRAGRGPCDLRARFAGRLERAEGGQRRLQHGRGRAGERLGVQPQAPKGVCRGGEAEAGAGRARPCQRQRLQKRQACRRENGGELQGHAGVFRGSLEARHHGARGPHQEGRGFSGLPGAAGHAERGRRVLRRAERGRRVFRRAPWQPVARARSCPKWLLAAAWGASAAAAHAPAL
mmetsp:Transcript_33299/g.90174  ORF Transcript_33299/g.90174 Transcript_33299/m.90174 type:complete len:314 (+) Transcript_33299:977-1918(+)